MAVLYVTTAEMNSLVGAWDTVSTRNLIVKAQSPNKDALKTIYRTLASVSVLVNHQNDTHQYRYLCVGMRNARAEH